MDLNNMFTELERLQASLNNSKEKDQLRCELEQKVNEFNNALSEARSKKEYTSNRFLNSLISSESEESIISIEQEKLSSSYISLCVRFNLRPKITTITNVSQALSKALQQKDTDNKIKNK